MRTEGPNAEKLIKAFLNEPEETQFLEFKRVNGKGLFAKWVNQGLLLRIDTDSGPKNIRYKLPYRKDNDS